MGTCPPCGGRARKFRWRRTLYLRPEPGRTCFNCRRNGHVARQCPEPRRGKRRTMLVRPLSDFLFVWKPYRPKGRRTPPKVDGPTELQLELIRKARRSFTKDLPRRSVAKLRLPDGSVWPLRGQVAVPTLAEHFRVLPVEVLGQVLAYLDPFSLRGALIWAPASRRERRHLRRCIRTLTPDTFFL